MIQSGTLYTVDSTGKATNVPIKGAFILFKQNNSVIKKIETNSTTGAYSVDLTAGKYLVEIAKGSVTIAMRAGQLFELKSTDKADALQKWMYSQAGDVNDQLLNSFRQIADQANTSALNAKISENNAKKTVDDFNENTVGSGRLMKEGAFGIGGNAVILAGSNKTIEELTGGKSGLYVNNSTGSNVTRSAYGIYAKHLGNYESWLSWSHTIVANINLEIFGPTGKQSVSILNSGNTTKDSNGFLKTASPVVQLFNDRIEHSGFNDAPIFEKISVGVYKISNTSGLAKGVESGDWYIELPKDRYGDPYFNCEYERTDDGVIIRIYERIELYVETDRILDGYIDREGSPLVVKEKVVINGKLIDLREEWRCIDLRFHEEPQEEIEAPYSGAF